MVSERSNLDYGRDDDRLEDEHPVEGDGFVMTDPIAGTQDPGLDDSRVVDDVDADDIEEVNPEASSYGSP